MFVYISGYDCKLFVSEIYDVVVVVVESEQFALKRYELGLVGELFRPRHLLELLFVYNFTIFSTFI